MNKSCPSLACVKPKQLTTDDEREPGFTFFNFSRIAAGTRVFDIHLLPISWQCIGKCDLIKQRKKLLSRHMEFYLFLLLKQSSTVSR